MKHEASSNQNKTRLMIVAHPDDEVLFGGNELINHEYYIVCLTNGDNELREAEFQNMLDKTKNTGVILSYPDKVKGERSNWSKEQEVISKEVEKIIITGDWDRIVTHNPQGEYGHIQHKKTNEIVTNVVKELHKEDTLYYFGEYFKKDDIAFKQKKLNKQEANQKREVLAVYESQKKTLSKLDHIVEYEELVPYLK
ncbi:PIG-L family deacetylase [Breznakia sp. OttesenSCG-928-G09]|nr:PIG-L family deacetylase [Breznakia sp. OttesenSCG-928-G09]